MTCDRINQVSQSVAASYWDDPSGPQVSAVTQSENSFCWAEPRQNKATPWPSYWASFRAPTQSKSSIQVAELARMTSTELGKLSHTLEAAHLAGVEDNIRRGISGFIDQVEVGVDYSLKENLGKLPPILSQALAPYSDSSLAFTLEMREVQKGLIIPLIILKYLKPRSSATPNKPTPSVAETAAAKGKLANGLPRTGITVLSLAGGILIGLSFDQLMSDKLTSPKIRALANLSTTLTIMELGHQYLPSVFGKMNYGLLPSWLVAQTMNAIALHGMGDWVQNLIGLENNPLQSGSASNTLGSLAATAGQFYGVYRLTNSAWLAKRYPALMPAVRQAAGISTIEGAAVSASAAAEIGMGGKALVKGIGFIRWANVLAMGLMTADWAETWVDEAASVGNPAMALEMGARNLAKRKVLPGDIASNQPERLQKSFVQEIWYGLSGFAAEKWDLLFDNENTNAKIQAIEQALVDQSDDFARRMNEELISLFVNHLLYHNADIRWADLESEIMDDFKYDRVSIASQYDQIQKGGTGSRSALAQRLTEVVSYTGWLWPDPDVEPEEARVSARANFLAYLSELADSGRRNEVTYLGERLVEMGLNQEGSSLDSYPVAMQKEIIDEIQNIKTRAEFWSSLRDVLIVLRNPSKSRRINPAQMKAMVLELEKKQPLAMATRAPKTVTISAADSFEKFGQKLWGPYQTLLAAN